MFKTKKNFFVAAILCLVLAACWNQNTAEGDNKASSKSSESQAKKEGAILWASGNEPPWIVELYGDKMVILRGYDLAREEQEYAGDGLSYYSLDYTLKKSVTPCVDSMSGQQFSHSFTLVSQKETLHGCGSVFR